MSDQSNEEAPPLFALERLKSMNDEEYQQTIRSYAPELDGGPTSEDADLLASGWPGRVTVEAQDVLSPRSDFDVELTGYLASALTGLSSESKQFVSHLSHTVAEIGRQVGIKVYEPRNITDPVHNANIEDWRVWKTDRDRVVTSDLLIHLAHFPSTGSGEELSFAYDAMVPIIVISHREHTVSRMVTGIPTLLFSITYEAPEEMSEQLQSVLLKLKPSLIARRAALIDNHTNIFGARLREARELRGLTRAALSEASHKKVYLAEKTISQWEESTDQANAPTLVQLRAVAALLGVSVSDLIEPSPDAAVMAYLSRYVDLQAARGGKVSDGDKSVLKRRVLQRLMDVIDD